MKDLHLRYVIFLFFYVRRKLQACMSLEHETQREKCEESENETGAAFRSAIR